MQAQTLTTYNTPSSLKPSKSSTWQAENTMMPKSSTMLSTMNQLDWSPYSKTISSMMMWVNSWREVIISRKQRSGFQRYLNSTRNTPRFFQTMSYCLRASTCLRISRESRDWLTKSRRSWWISRTKSNNSKRSLLEWGSKVTHSRRISSCPLNSWKVCLTITIPLVCKKMRS